MQTRAEGSKGVCTEEQQDEERKPACMEGCSVLPHSLPPALIRPLYGVAVELVLGSQVDL